MQPRAPIYPELLIRPDVRATAAEALRAINPMDSERPLLAALHDDASPGVRAAAALGLSQHRKPEITQALVAAYAKAPAEVRQAILESLSGRDDPQAQALVRQTHDEELGRVRRRVGQ